MRISLTAVARFPHVAFAATYVESHGQNDLHVLVEHAATNSPTPMSNRIGNYEKLIFTSVVLYYCFYTIELLVFLM